MKKNEFAVVLKRIEKYYPGSSLVADAETFDLWYGRLKEYPFDVMVQAVDEYVDAFPRPPHICDLKKFSDEILRKENEILTESMWNKEVEEWKQGQMKMLKQRIEDMRTSI